MFTVTGGLSRCWRRGRAPSAIGLKANDLLNSKLLGPVLLVAVRARVSRASRNLYLIPRFLRSLASLAKFGLGNSSTTGGVRSDMSLSGSVGS